MRTAESIKKELKNLLEKQDDLVKLARDTKDTIAFGTAYQHWYSRAYKLVESLAPERLGEFASYYRIDPKRKMTTFGNYVIQDYIMGIGARINPMNEKPLWDANNLVTLRITNQIQIHRFSFIACR